MGNLNSQWVGYLVVLVDVRYLLAEHLLPFREQVDDRHLRHAFPQRISLYFKGEGLENWRPCCPTLAASRVESCAELRAIMANPHRLSLTQSPALSGVRPSFDQNGSTGCRSSRSSCSILNGFRYTWSWRKFAEKSQR
jgi:hypothetical protein